jgi:hypothetical protein
LLQRGDLQSGKRVGIVVPTIFARPLLLPHTLDSIHSENIKCTVILSAPSKAHSAISPLLLHGEMLIDESAGASLPEVINSAIAKMPDSVEYITWLGDDDLLHPGTIAAGVKVLDENSKAVLVYGSCRYINRDGQQIGFNRSGRWAAKILGFGPDLVPQPGAIWRRTAFEAVGGLSSEFDLAFDYDLFLKLKGEGELVFIPRTVASFRWHPDSLSVKKRSKSVLEASQVRRNHYKGLMRALWPLWEPWIITATWFAGKLLKLRLPKVSK